MISSRQSGSSSGRKSTQYALAAGLFAAGIALLTGCGGSDAAVANSPAPLALEPQALTPDQDTAQQLVSSAAGAGARSLRIVRDERAFEELERFTRDLIPRIFDGDNDGNNVNINCRRNPFRLAPFLCYGELSFQANQRTTDGNVVANTIFNLQFDNFQVLTPNFDRLRVTGGIRLEYLTDVSISPRRGTLRYESSGLSTNKDDNVFSASDGALTVLYSDDSTVIETDRERLVDVSVDARSDNEGDLRSGSTRANFSSGYVDFAWNGWPISGGRPAQGARVSVTGADGTSATIAVQDVQSDPTIYRVTITYASGSSDFEVRISLLFVVGVGMANAISITLLAGSLCA